MSGSTGGLRAANDSLIILEVYKLCLIFVPESRLSVWKGRDGTVVVLELFSPGVRANGPLSTQVAGSSGIKFS